MIRYLAYCSLSVLLCPPLLACPVRTRFVSAPVVVKEKVVVVDTVAVATFAPVVIAVQPVYGAAYVPPVVGAAGVGVGAGYAASAGAPPATPAAAFTPAQEARIIELVAKGVRAAGVVPAGKPEPVPPPKDGPPPTPKGETAAPDATRIFAANCAKCHSQGKLAAGTTFEMFDASGKVLLLTDRQWGKVGAKVATGRMPPPIKDASGAEKAALTDEDAAAIADWLDKRK